MYAFQSSTLITETQIVCSLSSNGIRAINMSNRLPADISIKPHNLHHKEKDGYTQVKKLQAKLLRCRVKNHLRPLHGENMADPQSPAPRQALLDLPHSRTSSTHPAFQREQAWDGRCQLSHIKTSLPVLYPTLFLLYFKTTQLHTTLYRICLKRPKTYRKSNH